MRHLVAGRGSRPARWPRRAARWPPRSCRTTATSRPRRPRRCGGAAAASRSPAARYTSAVQSSASANDAGAGHTTIRSCRSSVPAGVGAAADDLDLGQRHRAPAVAGELAPTAARRRRGGRRRRRPSTWPPSRCRRGATGRRCRRARPARRRLPTWSRGVEPAERRGDLVVHGGDRAAHVVAAAARRRRRAGRRASPDPRRRPGRRDGPADRAAAQRTSDLDRRAAARVPDPAADDTRSIAFAHRADPHASRPAAPIGSSVGGGCREQRHAQRRARRLRRSSSRYSTGDLPSTRASSSAGSSAAARASSVGGGSQPTLAQVGVDERVEARAGTRRVPPGSSRHLSSRWLSAEGEVEGGVAAPWRTRRRAAPARPGRRGCSSGSRRRGPARGGWPPCGRRSAPSRRGEVGVARAAWRR